MTRRLPPGMVVLVLLVTAAATSARANPPQIKGITPLGIQRGVMTEVTINGADLAGNPQVIAPFAFEAADKPSGDAANCKLKITVPAGVAPGAYPIRVKTDDGISNPFLFAVGQAPQHAEKESNNTFETAQALPALPLIVEGQASGNDVDYFKFSGKKGQRIVVDAQCARVGSSLDPQIRLTTAAREFVAAADDSPGLLTDARLFAVLPADTDYVLEISDSKYQGAGRPVYRVVIGPLPVAEEVYPLGGRRGETVGFELRGGTLGEGLRVAAATVNGPPAADLFRPTLTNQAIGLVGPGDPVFDLEFAKPLVLGDVPEQREPADPSAPSLRAAVPVAINGRIDPAGDEDRVTLAVTPGQSLRIAVQAADFGSALDGTLQVLKPDGAQLASADDTTSQPARRGAAANNAQQATLSPDPSLTYSVPSGTTEIVLALRDLEGRGGIGFPYRILVEPIAPGFEIAVSESEISVPRGGTAVLGAAITRRNFNGPITLTVLDPPKGLTVRPGLVAGGQNVGALSVSAAPDADFGAVELKVVGTAEGGVTAAASHEIVFAEQGNFPINSLKQVGVAAAPSQAAAVTFDAPGQPVEIVHGVGGSVPIQVKRSEGADAAFTLASLTLPPGVAFAKDAKIAEKVAEAAVALEVSTDAAVGQYSVALTAKGKIKDKEQTLAIPAVTLSVVRPVTVELEKPALEIKPGETVEFKGKIVRKGGFKEPVTLKITGLPKGLKADPITIAPDAADFNAKIIAEANAAPAADNALAAASFQINKKDYPAQSTGFAVKIVK